MLNLSEERRERLLGTLPDEHFSLIELKKGALRLFHDIAPMNAQTSSNTSGRQRWKRQWQPRRRYNAYEIELLNGQSQADANEDCSGDLADAEDDLADNSSLQTDTVDPADLQGIVRGELEGLVQD